MTDSVNNPEASDPRESEESEATGPVVRDKRRLDPETGEVRQPEQSAADLKAAEAAASTDGLHPDTLLAQERLEDLQRLQAEYVNYKKRVDRDRDTHREAGAIGVLDSILPVLDEIHLARQHGDLEGSPFEKIADKLDAVLTKHGLVQYGAVGDAFDPTVHEALMHIQAEVPEGSEGTTVVQVIQPGYKLGDRVLRPARVAVADPA
ncbi:nucleotide exchange factor GrpE [Branchiibius sp. NY16-3462-2]|uniref:nucleotide exchange factor GrpE n=1 Tax=Branchiibius sp. NY16-3462-2 TaxID=1807500 RepID=UPI0007951833|nr:nucleotide exchange factor GrpE [Branchiibius sp. NY16-3462-2]KYH43451.1 hypothetical protein AZH51_17015 [Branchiibius sp. NY16-3462-2]